MLAICASRQPPTLPVPRTGSEEIGTPTPVRGSLAGPVYIRFDFVSNVSRTGAITVPGQAWGCRTCFAECGAIAEGHRRRAKRPKPGVTEAGLYSLGVFDEGSGDSSTTEAIPQCHVEWQVVVQGLFASSGPATLKLTMGLPAGFVQSEPSHCKTRNHNTRKTSEVPPCT